MNFYLKNEITHRGIPLIKEVTRLGKGELWTYNWNIRVLAVQRGEWFAVSDQNFAIPSKELNPSFVSIPFLVTEDAWSDYGGCTLIKYKALVLFNDKNKAQLSDTILCQNGSIALYRGIDEHEE